MHEPLVRIKNLSKYYPIEKGFIKKTIGHVKAVNDIDLSIYDRETLGLVGESGCGKSTTGNCIVRLIEPTSGSIEFRLDKGDYVDLAKIPEKQMLKYRSQIQMIFQDPYSSLNPRMTVQDIIAEPIRMFITNNKTEIRDRVAQMMDKVGLRPEYMRRYPHAFSGGQRQRIGIARALTLNPKFIVCDESVSSLDVSVQAQVLGLLEDLQQEFNISYLFIAHDLSAVKHISYRVAVMYVGKIVEVADCEELFENPKHPYTEALLESVPKVTAEKGGEKMLLSGEVPDPSNPPSGCYFHPRCKYAKPECEHIKQELKKCTDKEDEEHKTTCIRSAEIYLRGVSDH